MACSISSNAVLKYEEPLPLVYVQLEKFTDLNLPPSNWLNDNLAGKFSSFSAKKRKTFDCTSLIMAEKYPEYMEEVDVVSAAEHIKKLLKIPFSSSQISMSVHRIGRALLLNDFDIPTLLHSHIGGENNKPWNWLHDLYSAETQKTELFPKKRNKELSHLEIMRSKFMYYSISESKAVSDGVADKQLQSVTDNCAKNLTSSFQRDILWNFEDITMLVGSDLPIFGGGKYPAVSLRLHESSKPISVLTGIDYWLDNLMCNVPELIMCYHLNGIVQKYEQFKTSELPNLEGSSFSPKVICDVAQNILSFLKSNCTKEGHTYWLFKSRKDDVVKLYDLTSIGTGEGHKDPFKVSVAMLLYRIARNMYNSHDLDDKNAVKLVRMLENCICLISDEDEPTLSFDAGCLLSQLYTNSLLKNKENHDDSDSDLSFEDDESESEKTASSISSSPISTISVKTMCVSSKVKKPTLPPEPLPPVSIEMKCKKAIVHIANSLALLSKMSNYVLPSSGNAGNPLLLNNKEQPLTLVNQNLQPFKNKQEIEQPRVLKEDLTVRDNLFTMAIYNYLALVDIYISKRKFGHGLRCIKLSFCCYSCIQQKSVVLNSLVKLIMFYADILTIMSKSNINTSAEMEDFHAMNEYDLKIFNVVNYEESASKDMESKVDIESIQNSFKLTKELLLVQSAELYEEALLKAGRGAKDLATTENENVNQVVELTRRLGNIRNELGAMYMNQAAGIAKLYGYPTDSEIQLWKKSLLFFQQSVQAFEIVNDKENLALVYSNSGKLMYLCAKVYGNILKKSQDDRRGQFTQEEKTYFGKTFEYYNKALSVLQNKEYSPIIWENISLELSGCYFTMGCLIQDHAPLTTNAEENVIKDVSSAFMKALQFSEPLLAGSSDKNQVLMRVGAIHHRLGSLYHHILRNQISDSDKKNFRSLAELHYKKVHQVLSAEHFPLQVLQVIVESAALYDYLLQQHHSLKYLKLKLDVLSGNLQLITCLKNLLKRNFSSNELCLKTSGETDTTELMKLSCIIYNQLSSTFKDAILMTKKAKRLEGLEINALKSCFEIILRNSIITDTNVVTMLEKLLLVLSKIHETLISNEQQSSCIP